MNRLYALLPVLVLAACSTGPRPIRYGEEAGAYCKMTITDERYGAELVTKKGKVYPFDSVECMASFYLNGTVPREEVAGLYVTDFQNPPALVPAPEAFFLLSNNLRSPMGLNLTAFSAAIGRGAVENAFSGTILSWDEVLARVETRLAEGEGPVHGGHREAGS